MKMDEKLEKEREERRKLFYPGILKMICLVKWVIMY